MMLVLSEISEKTESIFGHDVQIPVPPQIWKDRLIALEEANLVQQRASLIFDMRKWQAKELGFEEIDSSTMVEMIMGEKHTDDAEGEERQNHEWAYNHHIDELLSKNWGSKPTIFKRKDRTNFWHLPPFSKKVKWEVQFGKLDYLKRDIPYGVILKIEEMKKLKLFNGFNVIAPMEAWQRKSDIDPIVVGSIWELPPNDKGEYNSAGQTAHFFLAQW